MAPGALRSRRSHLLLGVALSSFRGTFSSDLPDASADIPPQVLAGDDACAGAAGGSDCGFSALQHRKARVAAAAADGGALRGRAPARVERRFFVWLSDIHMDPVYGRSHQFGNDSAVCVFGCDGVTRRGCKERLSAAKAKRNPYGYMGCDPPFKLWEATVEAAAAAAQGAEFVLFTGDFARHHQDMLADPFANVTDIMGRVGGEVRKRFTWLDPEHVLAGTLGNDDSPRNYMLNVTSGEPTNRWLSNVAGRLEAVHAMPAGRAQNYSYGGFFEARVGGLTVINFNTIVYSIRHSPKEPMEDDPFGQLAWLRQRLESALRENRTVWIAGHVPPGMETFGYTPLWHPQYVQAYLDIVQDPALGGVVGAQLFGHTHSDEFRLLPQAPPAAGPLLVTGAVSPIYHSNPAFRVVEYDAVTGRLLNVKIFYAELPRWGKPMRFNFGYDFVGSYAALADASRSPHGLTNAAFRTLASNLKESWRSGGKEFDTYARWYKTRYANDLQCALNVGDIESNGISTAMRDRYAGKYFCALSVGPFSQFANCANEYTVNNVTRNVRLDETDPELIWQPARQMHLESIGSERELEIIGKCNHMSKEAEQDER